MKKILPIPGLCRVGPCSPSMCMCFCSGVCVCDARREVGERCDVDERVHLLLTGPAVSGYFRLNWPLGYWKPTLLLLRMAKRIYFFPSAPITNWWC